VCWKKKFPSILIISGVLLATFGAGYIQGPPELHFDFAEWLTVLCALMFAGHIIATDVVTKRSSPIAVTFTSILLSALICFLVSIVYVSLNPGELQIIGLLTDSEFLIPLILTAVFGTFIALTLVNYFQKLLDPVRASVLYALEPVWATILAIGFGMEKFTLWLILGGSALVVGNIIAEIGTYKAVK
jgi:drug/metabolite transporter (DMT)-like permease